MTRLLMIDDDSDMCIAVSVAMQAAGFGIDTTCIAKDGLRLALSGRYDMAIIDLGLPLMDGFEVLRLIRAESDLPVLLLTGHPGIRHRIFGLEVGADDYLEKPVDLRELAARIRAILRRTQSIRTSSVTRNSIRVGDIELDVPARYVRCGDRNVTVTATELALLQMLLCAAGTVVSREELSTGALGRPCDAFDRSIDVHLSNLRKKLGPTLGGGDRIQSVRGTGYVYVLEPLSATRSLSA